MSKIIDKLTNNEWHALGRAAQTVLETLRADQTGDVNNVSEPAKIYIGMHTGAGLIAAILHLADENGE